MRSNLLATSFLFALTASLAAQEVRAGPWQTAGKIPVGWVVHNTKYYHVQSQCGLDKAKRLGEHMEVMNVVYRKMFKPDKDGAKQYTIKLFKDEPTYHSYGGPQGAAAYYSWTAREMVCYDSGKWSDEEKTEGAVTGPETARDRLRRRRSKFMEMMTMDLLGTAAHEGWHQYFDWYVGSKVELPSWIDEGMGDYFYCAAPQRQKGAKKGAAEVGRMNDGRLWVIQAAKRQNLMVPLQTFVSMLQSAYYTNPDVCYAQGWVFCQFLLHGEGGKYTKIIPNYVRLIRSDSNWPVVTEKAFKGIDFAVMDTEFKAFIDTLKPSIAEPEEEEEEAGEGEAVPPAVPPVVPPVVPPAVPPAVPPPPPPAGGGTGPGGTGPGGG